MNSSQSEIVNGFLGGHSKMALGFAPDDALQLEHASVENSAYQTVSCENA